MATIRKSDVVQRMIDGCSLSPAEDKIPQELANTVVPTFSVNQKPRRFVRSEIISNNQVTLTVPTGKMWRILYGCIIYTASATVGNRVFTVTLGKTTGTKTVWSAKSHVNQTAGQAKYYNISPGTDTPNETVSGKLFMPFPATCVLCDGMFIKLLDATNVDVADTMDVELQIEEMDNSE